MDSDAPGDRDNPLFVTSVEKGMRVLSELAAARRPLSLAEIATASGMGRSAAQRFVFTLKALGYIDQETTTRHYVLSPRILQFADAYVSRDAVQQIAAPILDAANRECEETVNLSVLDGDEVVFVLRFPSHHVVSVDLHVGSRLPAYCTSPGRVMLAFRDPEEARRIIGTRPLKAWTQFTVTDPRRVMSILDEVRAAGFCINDQEAFIGDISTAAPVFDRTGRPVAAVNIAVPAPRWTVDRLRSELTPIAIKAAHSISRALGWRPPAREPAVTGLGMRP